MLTLKVTKQKCTGTFDTPYFWKKSYKALFFFNLQEKIHTMIVMMFIKKFIIVCVKFLQFFGRRDTSCPVAGFSKRFIDDRRNN